MAIKSIQQKTSQRGTTFWNVELGTPDGSTLLATIWDSDVRQALGNLSRADVEVERNAKGYAKITAAKPAVNGGPQPVFTANSGNPATGYRYLALDATSKIFQGAGIGLEDTIEYAAGLAYWMEHGIGPTPPAPSDEWRDAEPDDNLAPF